MDELTKNKSLPILLHELSDLIANEVKSAKIKNKIQISKTPYSKLKILDLEYDKGITQFEMDIDHLTKEEWLGKDHFIDEYIKETKLCEEILRVIRTTYDVEETKAEKWVFAFIQRITNVSLNGINSHNVIDLVNLFISELEKNPTLWNPVAWINGVWMETDVIDIQDNISIRKPRAEDLEFQYDGTLSPLSNNLDPHKWPSAILECEFRVKYPIAVQNNIDSIVNAFRLFKISSIEVISIQFNNDSILGIGGGRVSTVNLATAHYKYGLSQEDIKPLQDFFTKIEPLIHSEIVEKSANESNYLSIAHERYCDALLKPIVPENRLATAIMALEALYLKEKEMAELSERLSQRVAMALKPFGYNALKVYNDVKRAYGYRSSYVHGSKVKQKDIPELTKTILDYCRLSIIIFLQIHNELEKDKMINLLSYSLLDDGKRAEYHEIMKDKYPYH